MIVLNSHITSEGFLNSLKSLIQSFGHDFDCVELDGSIVLITKSTPVMQDFSQSNTDANLEEPYPTEVPPVEVGAEIGSIDDAPALQPVYTDELSAIEDAYHECSLLGLGTCILPCIFDITQDYSELRVGQVENLPSHVIFNYAGITYKHPKIETENAFPCIRVLVRFNDTGETRPYIVKVTQKEPNEIDSLVLNSSSAQP